MGNTNRREFIASLSAVAAVLPFSGIASNVKAEAVKEKSTLNFVLLGDLHFDKFKHHDVHYMREHYPNDIGQVTNYSRITWENLPELMKRIKVIANQMDAAFILQMGDFLEGLAGSKELATLQAQEFIQFVADHEMGRPFIVTKGNHDITGTGSKEVYRDTVLPWQEKELQRSISSSNVSFVHKNARFVMFDGYRGAESLNWLKTILSQHKEKHLFFSVHEPVVPYNSRSSWHVFNKNPELYQELVNLLGRHGAIVFGGHLHKTCILARKTPFGKFVQIGIGSVINDLDGPVKDHLQGIENYNSDLVLLEPDFSPSSLQMRREILKRESPFITHYEYADFNGYGTVKIKKDQEVELSIYANIDHKPWTTVNLSNLLKG